MKYKISVFAVAGVTAMMVSESAIADDNKGVYSLGEIHVVAPANSMSSEIDAFGGSTISNQQNETFAKPTLEKSVNLAPGVVGLNTGSQRNDTNIFVHGFDRWQVPLTLDGVRVYLPQDNRLDFARFVTPDVAVVQIAKGYVSVLDGPGGMGGAINLVSRKPTRPFEFEGRQNFEFGTNGGYEGVRSYARSGGRQGNYYGQVSGTWNNIQGWMLSQDFAGTANQGPGMRVDSGTRDWSVNAKAGWTPNATDEYSINFSKQEGSKGAPLHITDPIASQRYWRWPEWNVQTLSFNSYTQLGSSSYLKTNVAYANFDNTAAFYSDAKKTTQNATNTAQNSIYSDWNFQAKAEAGTDIGTIDTLKGALHYRRDNHDAWADDYYRYTFSGGTIKTTGVGCTANVVCFTEPTRTSVEDTYSVAIENTIHVTPTLDLVQGASYDWTKLLQAQDYDTKTTIYQAPFIFDQPLANMQAPNYQAAAIWRYAPDAKLFANVSDRTRFPTLFERFSTRFNTTATNPNLQPERAINYQIGWAKNFAPGSQVSIATYYSDVNNIIQSVLIDAINNIRQSQNVGSGNYYGADFAVDYAWRSDLTIGGHVSYIQRTLVNPASPGMQLTGVPDYKGMIYASYTPMPNLKLTPYVEMASGRWTQTSASGTPPSTYYKTSAYAIANFGGEYNATQEITLNFGVRNIFDTYYTLVDGYPEVGRSFYVGVKGVF
jgi:iron complex outermembrane receptor protein